MDSRDTAVKVETLSKIYRIGLWDETHDNLFSSAWAFFKSPIRNYRKYRSLYRFDDLDGGRRDQSADEAQDAIWALREVSFEVKRGEVLGIIGKNGAGKSTLLKILSRITEPTKGYAEIRGRVSSLLEVGTGFHQELTGRENIYLNGTILGMRREEVKRKFDEIVAFSGIEKFIDTPVKRYSSGMKVRLAFSVAAHLEPDILIVDEVLAVGDVEFQKKCLGRMKEVGRKGRTVLLVSHNMSAITSLCKRAIWIDDGKVQENGPVVQVVSSYLSSVKRPSGKWYNRKPSEDDSDVRILAAYCRSNGGEIQSISHFGEALTLEIHYEIIECIVNLWILIRISDALGNVVFSSADVDSTGLEGSTRDRGRFCSTCKIPKGFLRPGEYTLSIMAMVDGKKLHAYHENVLSFEISDVGYPFTHLRKGVITPMLAWEVKRDKCSNTG